MGHEVSNSPSFSRERVSTLASLTIRGALALSLLIVACGSDPVGERRELSGFVTILGSGERVGGATVTFTADTLLQAETTTNGNGFYEMVVRTDVPFGQVRATKAGHQPGEETVLWDTNERRVDVQMRRDSE